MKGSTAVLAIINVSSDRSELVSEGEFRGDSPYSTIDIYFPKSCLRSLQDKACPIIINTTFVLELEHGNMSAIRRQLTCCNSFHI
mmetsp:Transcript_41469/g.68012  ORF Transcript_41469/g.68012 Transcript_41469/m.68012 type:complete len:85 (+) Transcript_41469:19-273(+)